MRKLLVFDPGKEKLVLCGYVDNDTFIRDVNASKHFMKIVGGYGIQEVAFAELEKRNIKNILLRETDTKLSWYSKLNDWIQHGKVADYSHGQQRFLTMKYMLLIQKGGEEINGKNN